LGDLMLTCSSPQSRNFAYGMALGRGESLEGEAVALRLARSDRDHSRHPRAASHPEPAAPPDNR
jgi:hypothetical protein